MNISTGNFTSNNNCTTEKMGTEQCDLSEKTAQSDAVTGFVEDHTHSVPAQVNTDSVKNELLDTPGEAVVQRLYKSFKENQYPEQSTKESLAQELGVTFQQGISFSIDETTLVNLFKSQQNHLNFFFDCIDHSQTLAFTRALLSSTGTVFFTGVGKSGFVAHKISQTLVSLGIRSSFLSPVDALHGDIGILSDRDVLVLLSKSGATEELLRLVPCAKAKGAMLIAVTSVEGNALSAVCDMTVHLPLERELCPFNLAPVTSTAIQMVFGDTVAIALMAARNLTKDEYAANHPAGKIGKSLIFKVRDVMKKDDELPICKESDLIMDQLVELTSKGCGCLLVIDGDRRLIGTFTDGDLRRTLKASGEAIFKLTVGKMCNRNPRTIGPEAMAVDAMKKMEAPPSPVQFLPVLDDDNVVIGIVTLHGLVSAGL